MNLEPLAFWKARSSWLALFAVLSSILGREIDVAYADLASQLVTAVLTGAALWQRKAPQRAISLTDANVQGALMAAVTSAPVTEKIASIARGLLK
ncbi:hypothetical protein [Mangrovicoccus sp. HB161399]|uniref:hypothetical protein n=1 Tax=Mangrovicoccus sp. HB161399 TaxID=2720392 RepID=UPI0015556804|nr:hypothetical protein [Mangrovicoccus sp. HB161399]